MTPTRYFFARITRAFGLSRRNQRMSEAAAETHLLKDAEAYLGGMVWEKTEKIDKLSTEYWNLRKLAKEKENVEARLVECQERLNKAHEERAALLNVVSEPEKDLSEERNKILTRLSALALRRDEVIAAAKEIRHSYDGLKVKSEVLAGQTGDDKPGEEEFDKIKASLVELKGRFSALKEERQKIADEIEKGDAEIDAISDKVREYKKVQYDQAAKAFQIIGDANKEISALRAEFGTIDTKMLNLHGEIGRHVSRNTSEDPACADAAKGQGGMVEVMKALRKSIALNHKLSEQ